MKKFNLIYEEIKTVADILNDCKVVYYPGDSENKMKCKSCGCDLIDKMYSLKDGNMCENCFNLLIKKPRKLADKPILKEGGNAFNDVGPILKENIKPTLENLNELIFKPLNIDQSLWTAELGSVGKKSQSGDIDIAINMTELCGVFNVETINEVKNIIIEKLNENSIENRKVGVNIHLKFPISGSQDGEFVQIDFFPSSDLNYTKMQKFSPAENESKYKGVHRGHALASLIKAVSMNIADDAVDDERNEYIDPDGKKYPGLRFQHISMLDDGFYKVTKSFKGKKGILKSPQKDNSKSQFITKDFQEILNILFGEGRYTISDINSFETIWNNILMSDDFPYQDKLEDIVKSLYGLFKDDDHIIMPDEILKYIEDNNIDVSNI
jgi:hypothetical protein